MRTKSVLQVVIFLAFIGVAVAYWIGSRPTVPLDADALAAKAVLPQIGSTVPDFTLPQWGGDTPVNLASLRGQIVIVNFWATWCPPCVEEMPSFFAFAQWAGRELGVKTLALSVDQDPKNIQNFFLTKKLWSQGPLPITILLDARAAVASRYGTSKFPETYILGKDLKLLKKIEGPQNWMNEETKQWFREVAKH